MNLVLYGVPLAALVLALVQVAKETGLPGRLAPVASLIIGVAAGVALQFSLPHPDYLQGVVTGVAVGLSASGLYSGVSAFSAPAQLASSVLGVVTSVTSATTATPEPVPAAPQTPAS